MDEAGKQPEKCCWAAFKAQAMPRCSVFGKLGSLPGFLKGN